MATIDLNQLGRAAYEAYSHHADGRSLVTGDPLPVWLELPEEIRAAWVAAATEAVDQWAKSDAAQDRCHDSDCDGPAGHDGPHHQWVPE